MQQQQLHPPMGESAMEMALKKGHINTQGTMGVQVLDLSETSREAQLQHEDAMRKFEAQSRARAVIVPTDVEEVKMKLRSLDHPITLFGEGPADRRERLKSIIAEMELDAEGTAKMQEKMLTHDGSSSSGAGGNETEESAKEIEQKKKQTFYTHATEEIIQLRIDLSKESFEKTHQRLLGTKRIRESEELQAEEDKQVATLYRDSKQISLIASQYAHDRPLTYVRMAKDSKFFASSSLDPIIKVWDSETNSLVTSLTGHMERVTSVTWHPQAFTTDGPALLASTSADSCCLLWDARAGDINSDSSNSKNGMQINSNNRTEEDIMRIAAASSAGPSHSSAIMKLQGHQGLVSRCEFHPYGRYIGTAGYDYSWRLWDVETGKELLLQDGHSRECSAIAFQSDGALVFTADWAGVCLLWDLRSGQAIQTFQGHIKKIVNAHFSPNGFQVATASVDNSVRIWDVRKRKCGYALPAHSSIISDARFSASGELLLTSSFDGKLKIWGARDYRLLRVLSGHAGRVMSCDFGSSERQIVSAGFDRTVKIWSNDE